MKLWRSLRSDLVLLLLLSCMIGAAHGADSAAGSNDGPHCPSPPVPGEALFLGDWGDLELTLVADSEGKIVKSSVSKASRAKIFDERIRTWVEKNWKMGRAGEKQTSLRTFKAPIVFHGGEQWPAGGKYPAPSYPWKALRAQVEGGLAVSIHVRPSGEVESATVFVGSGSRELDEHTVDWVKRRWRFPPSESKRTLHWVCEYKIHRTQHLPTDFGLPAGLK